MPHQLNPSRGWIASANNRPAPDSYGFPLAGTWSDDLRARRIRERIEAVPKHSRAEAAAIHFDTLSLRAVNCVPRLLAVLDDPASWQNGAKYEDHVVRAIAILRAWDFRIEPDRAAAAIFNVFFAGWAKSVVEARFAGESAVLLAGGASGLASALLAENLAGWFLDDAARRRAIVATFTTALDTIAARLGPEISSWSWGRLHRLDLKHVLSGRGDLGVLLDHGGLAVAGDFTTVCNTGQGPEFDAKTGAGFRMVAALDPQAPVLFSHDAQSQSGHPGSPHYGDQLRDWLAGRYHEIPLHINVQPVHSRRLVPESKHPAVDSETE
jgi:penicillin amidase